MGLLDDLKRDAERAKDIKAAEQARQDERESVYRELLAPKLREIHRYLAELIELLEKVDWSVAATYRIPGLDEPQTFEQGEYRIISDSQENPRQLAFQCVSRHPEQRRYAARSAVAEELRGWLINERVPFTDWPVRDDADQVVMMMFEMVLQVKGTLLFEVDIDNARIRLATHNFEVMGVREYQFGPALIDDAWLDDLGHFVVRRKPVPGGLGMTEETRERLRQMVERERARRDRERSGKPADEPSKTADSTLLNILRMKVF